MPDAESLDAVYYSAPAPRSLSSLTYLGLVFDRLIFPAVHVPTDIDVDATVGEIERLRALPDLADNPDTVYMLNLLIVATQARYLQDFCVFTGSDTGMGILEQGAAQLTHDLELAVFGPPPPNFFPTITTAFSKAVPGSASSLNSPSWLAYPANAFLYAARHGTVLVNDAPEFPVPGPVTSSIKANATQLSTVLALEAVRLSLPGIQRLTPPQLAEFRAETTSLVRPFRRAMLRLSRDLNQAISSDMPLANVRREAAFLVESTVLPELEEMRAALSRPTQPWHRRIGNVVAATPEIVGAFATMPTGLAVAKALAKVVNVLADVRDAQLERDGNGKRAGFHYLLKVNALGKVPK